MAGPISIDDYQTYLDGLKNNIPYGTVVFMNEKGTYIQKNLEHLSDGDGTVMYAGCSIDEPLFFCGFSFVDHYGWSNFRVFAPQSPFSYLTPLEQMFHSKDIVPSLEEYKIGIEHFRKPGSWFVLMVQQDNF